MDGAFAHDPIEHINDAARRLGLHPRALKERASKAGLRSGFRGRPKAGVVIGLRRSQWDLCGGKRQRGPKPKAAVPEFPRAKKRWTPEESERLAHMWGEIDPPELCKALGRSWDAISGHAIDDLGLPSGLPSGWVSIKEAGRTLGYDPKTILNIAARNGVRIRPHPCPVREQTNRASVRWSTPHRCIELDAIREAVEHETKRVETVKGAAQARGLHDNQLRRWLIADGVMLGRSGKGRAMRFPTEIIDRVVNEHRALSVEGARA